MFPKPKTLRSDRVKRFNPGISQPRPKQSFLWQAGMFPMVPFALCLGMSLRFCLHCVYECVCNGACIVFMSVFTYSLALCFCVYLRVCLHCVYVCTCDFACIVFMCVFASSLACGKGGKLPAPHIGASVHSFWSRLGSNYCKRQFTMLSNWIGYE